VLTRQVGPTKGRIHLRHERSSLIQHLKRQLLAAGQACRVTVPIEVEDQQPAGRQICVLQRALDQRDAVLETDSIGVSAAGDRT